MPQDFECPFCKAQFKKLKTRPSRCPGCGVAFLAEQSGSHSTDLQDHAESLTDQETGKTKEVADTGQSIIPLFDSEDVKWVEVAVAAQAKAKRRPWTLHEAGGVCWLMRWRDRTADLRAMRVVHRAGQMVPANPQAPRVLPVFGEVATLDGKAVVVPIRRKHSLQAVLDRHTPGLRIENVPVFRNRPGRRHEHQASEWERDRDEMLRLRAKLRMRYPGGWADVVDAVEAFALDPDVKALKAFTEKWKRVSKCRWENCLNFIPRGSRQEYCSEACKTAGKRRRRIP